ncbi:SCF ubiquitin ligase complex subunit CDC4 [Sugiyamaella lignohabitans]|uniref:SCF ubiquitin ligase complex subunit CDC4 n=1 Tax=Sugiyamaella lignohabitans TaxID=796027 RepID=A0A167E3F0_9ASCO|nr:SCF ubiquitin ligase complex subunit CDC4 [Sugiyamaella lignohabitans]ANB13589.1 SCF ubiquitin ligase complex subunit CDC4 [Sugiyamaella lignohabitans]
MEDGPVDVPGAESTSAGVDDSSTRLNYELVSALLFNRRTGSENTPETTTNLESSSSSMDKEVDGEPITNPELKSDANVDSPFNDSNSQDVSAEANSETRANPFLDSLLTAKKKRNTLKIQRARETIKRQVSTGSNPSTAARRIWANGREITPVTPASPSADVVDEMTIDNDESDITVSNVSTSSGLKIVTRSNRGDGRVGGVSRDEDDIDILTVKTLTKLPSQTYSHRDYPLASEPTPSFLRSFRFLHNGVETVFQEEDANSIMKNPTSSSTNTVTSGTHGPKKHYIPVTDSTYGTITPGSGTAPPLTKRYRLDSAALDDHDSPVCTTTDQDIQEVEVINLLGVDRASDMPESNAISSPSPAPEDEVIVVREMHGSPHMSLPSPSASPIGSHNSMDQDVVVDQTRQQMFEQNESEVQDKDDLEMLSESDKSLAVRSPRTVHSVNKDTISSISRLVNDFDDLPAQLRRYVLFNLLKKSDRTSLSMMSNIIIPSLRCDFLSLLPIELSYNILSYLDHKSLCRAAQVSRKWRHIVDSSEWVWKNLLEKDNFALSARDYQEAVEEGWDYVSWKGTRTRTSSVSSSSTSIMPSLSTNGLYQVPARARNRCHDTSHVHDPHTNACGPSKQPSASFSLSSSTSSASSSASSDSSSCPPINIYKAIYRRKFLINRNWLNPNSRPKHLQVRGHGHDVVTCLQFDDERIITGSDDNTINVYDTKTGQLIRQFTGHDGGVWALKYINKRTLISGATDRTVRVWDIEKGKCTHVFYGHTSTVRCLDVIDPIPYTDKVTGQVTHIPEVPMIVTGSRDATLRMWRLPTVDDEEYLVTPPAMDAVHVSDPYFVRALRGHSNSVRAISGYGDTVVSGSYDTTVRVWNVATGECRWELTGHVQRVYSAVMDHKRNRCISGSMDWFVKVWCLETGSLLYTLEGHTSLVGLLDLNRTTLVSAAADSTLRIWDPEDGRLMHKLQGHQGAITCFQHDENKVVSGSEKTLKLWDTHSGNLVRDLLTDLSGIWQVCFDDRRCVVAVKRNEETYIEVLDFDYDPTEAKVRL